MNKYIVARTLFTFRNHYPRLGLPAVQRCENLYNILNVTKQSSDRDIRRAFLQLSKKYHPDANGDEHDSEEFTKICEAYRTLSKSTTRQQYDKQLSNARWLLLPIDVNYTCSKLSTTWERYQAQMRRQQFGSFHEPISVKTVPIVKRTVAKTHRATGSSALCAYRDSLPALVSVYRSKLYSQSRRSQIDWFIMLYMIGFAIVSGLCGADCVRDSSTSNNHCNQNVLLSTQAI